LIEELARVSGYDKLPERLLATEMPVPAGNRDLANEQRLQDLLADIGLTECVNYSLTSKAVEALLVPLPPGGGGVRGEGAWVELLNPISPERAAMRRSLLPGVLEVAARNLQAAEGVAAFELGFVYLPKAGEKLPDEPRRLTVVLCGRRSVAAWDDTLGTKPAQFDFFDAKGVVEAVFGGLHLGGATFEPSRAVPHLHPGKGAEVKLNGTVVGTVGELHPTVAAAFGLAERAVQVADLDAEAILAAVPDRYPYKPFSPLPAAKRDIAVIVPDEMPADRVLTEVKAAGGELLTDAVLFDVYRGDSIPAGTKSLAFALTYQSKDKTLTEKEIDQAHGKVEGRMRHVLKAQIRGREGA